MILSLIIVIALLLLVAIWFISGFGIATQLRIVSIDQTSEVLSEYLTEAGWTKDSAKQYYVASYYIDVRSITPLTISLQNAGVEITKTSSRVRVHTIAPVAVYIWRPFQHRGYSFPFLLETSTGISPEEVMREVKFVIRSEKNKWARIPVFLSSSLQIERSQEAQ